jgi:FkbM family methyltransferase
MKTFLSIKMTLLTFFFATVQIFGQSASIFYSQCGQDSFVYNTFFKNKTDGVFVDIGAHNGINLSNTYFFEKQCGWKGMCIEPMPEVFAQLRKNRDCICIEGCVYDKTGTVRFLKVTGPTMLSGIVETFDAQQLKRIVRETSNGKGLVEEIEVTCYKVNDLLALHGLSHIDYLSLDTEGSELEILKSIDFENITIDVIDVENNFHESKFEDFLNTKGYKKLTELAWDDIYVRTAWYNTISQ